MARNAAAATLLFAFGTSLAFATVGTADPPTTTSLATVYRTVVVTATVHERIQGKRIRWWATRAVHNRRALNAAATRLRANHTVISGLRVSMRRRWTPTVDYGIRLASRVFGVSESKMRAVAYCESTMNPFAQNGRYLGLFQLGWSPFGLSPFDPVASALSAAQTVARDGSWRQWSCG